MPSTKIAQTVLLCEPRFSSYPFPLIVIYKHVQFVNNVLMHIVLL